MTLVDDNIKRKEIAVRVQTVLDKHQPRLYRVSVESDAILNEDDWIQVLVTSPGDKRDRDFYDALAETEAELTTANDGYKYLLVPVIADN